MVFLVGSLLTTALLGLGLVSFHEEHDLTKVEPAEIVTLIAHTDPASAVGARGQQAEEQRGVGAGELPPAAQVQPGHLQVGERAEPGGGAGHVQPHHEDETGDHGANVVIIVI